MKINIEKQVTIITPTIGNKKLIDAIDSVKNQTYKNIRHLIVCDGYEYLKKISDLKISPTLENLKTICTPDNTGGDGYYGHRIYAGYPHLINSDYICFLDEDNWFEPEHVRSLVNKIEEDDLDFSFSLRSIYTEDKKFICYDNCESLGKWPIWFSHNDPQYLIDTSSYCFTNEFISKTCHLWRSGWGGDRRYLNSIMQLNPKFDTTSKHTLCYRLDGNQGSVKKEFFQQGNQKQLDYYKGNLPWI